MFRREDVSMKAVVLVHAAEIRQTKAIFLLLALLMGFASISTDFYLPALPTMAVALNARPGALAFTISGFLVGFTLGQLMWGPISDRYGRRKPLAIGVLLFVLGSAGCALSVSGASIIAARMVQALGASAGVVLARAMVRDLRSGNEAAQMLSTLMTVMAIAPLIGPLIGGQILTLAGWRAIFWTLVFIGVGTLSALVVLPETLPPARRNMAPLGRAFAAYGGLLCDRRLLGYAGACGCFYGATYAYIAGSPFAYIAFHHVPATAYGFLIAAGVGGMIVMNLVNGLLVTRLGLRTMAIVGAGMATMAGVIVAINAWTSWGGVAGLAVPLCLFVSMTGVVSANAIAGALSTSQQQTGAIAALIGAFQYGCGFVGSALVGILADGTPWPMALMVAIGAIGSLGCALSFPKRAEWASQAQPTALAADLPLPPSGRV